MAQNSLVAIIFDSASCIFLGLFCRALSVPPSIGSVPVSSPCAFHWSDATAPRSGSAAAACSTVAFADARSFWRSATDGTPAAAGAEAASSSASFFSAASVASSCFSASTCLACFANSSSARLTASSDFSSATSFATSSTDPSEHAK